MKLYTAGTFYPLPFPIFEQIDYYDEKNATFAACA